MIYTCLSGELQVVAIFLISPDGFARGCSCEVRNYCDGCEVAILNCQGIPCVFTWCTFPRDECRPSSMKYLQFRIVCVCVHLIFLSKYIFSLLSTNHPENFYTHWSIKINSQLRSSWNGNEGLRARSFYENRIHVTLNMKQHSCNY